MNTIRKEYVKGIEQADSMSKVRFIEAIFGITA